MLGNLIGDLAGARFEWNPVKTTDFGPLLPSTPQFTDDSVLTIAVADALLHNRDVVATFKDWGNRYPHSGWGGFFYQWLFSDDTEPYYSFGNGAAMRVAPAAFLANDLEEALALAERVTAVTHNHPEGLKGAAATTEAIFLALHGMEAEEIRKRIGERYGYDMDRSVEDIRPDYQFDETCQGTVSEALICAIEATDFEQAIRNAISLGGDADTLAAIAGGLAEALFGIPDDLAAHTLDLMPADMKDVLRALYARKGRRLPGAPSA